MKTYQYIVFYVILILAAIVAILASQRLIWDILIPLSVAGFGYLVWELDHAIPMPPEFNDDGLFETNTTNINNHGKIR